MNEQHEYAGCPHDLLPRLWSELHRATEGDLREMMGITSRMLLEMVALQWPTDTEEAMDGIVAMFDSDGRKIVKQIIEDE